MVFFFGPLIAAIITWFAVYPHFSRVTLVENRSNFVPRPTFLLHPLPEHRRETTSQAPQPRRRDESRTSSSSAAASADGAAGSSGGHSLVAVRAGGAAGSSSGHSAAAVHAAGAAGSSGGHSSAAMRADGAAGSHNGFEGASENGNLHTVTRRRRGVTRSRVPPLYLTQMGQWFHCDVDCYGLRNARSVHESMRCSTCGPVQSRPVVPLHGVGPGSSLH